MDPAYISALSALAGATIGGLTSFATSWTTQRAQLRHAHREAERAKLEALYSDFVAEAARLYGDALTHQTEEIIGLVQLYAMVGRMRLISDRAVVVAAVQVEDTIVATYLGPNRTLHEMMDIAHKGAMNFLTTNSVRPAEELGRPRSPVTTGHLVEGVSSCTGNQLFRKLLLAPALSMGYAFRNI